MDGREEGADPPMPPLPPLVGRDSHSGSSGSSFLSNAAASAGAVVQQPNPEQQQVKTGRRAAAAAAATISEAVRPRRRGAACVICKNIRAYCKGGFPCDRCWRLAIPCRPQSVGRGSVRGDEAATPGPSGNRSRGSADRSGEVAGPLLELAFARSTPRALAEMAAQSFVALQAAGQVVRAKALAVMRQYADMALALGSDPTWGAYTVMIGALSLTPIDLEAPHELVLDPPPARRQATVLGRLAKIKAASERAQADPAFQELETLYPGAAIFGAVSADGGPAYFANAVFDGWYQSSERFFDDMVRHKTLTTLLMSSLIDPDDRKTVVDAYVRCFYSESPKRESMIIKAFDHRGEMGLFLLHIHPFGKTAAVAICFERLPPSRHLTLRPGHHHVVQSFSHGNRIPPQTPFQQAAAAAAIMSPPSIGTGAARPLLSGLVAIPCDAAHAEQMQGAGPAKVVEAAEAAWSSSGSIASATVESGGAYQGRYGVSAEELAEEAGDAPLSPVDMELLQAILAGGEEEEGEDELVRSGLE